MSRYLSPLRYPGGKAKMAAGLIAAFAPTWAEVWFEPFAGGAGAGLRALAEDACEELWLAEADPAVSAIWTEIIDDAGGFAEAVAQLRPDLDSFTAARQTLTREDAPRRDLALAGLLVNRCSRSGIIAGSSGPIGGWNQSGRWKISDRFAPEKIAERIAGLGLLAGRIRMIADDGISALEELAGAGLDGEVFVYADPPYIEVGNRLYRAGLDGAGHARLAESLLGLETPWLLSIDDHPEARRLYARAEVGCADVAYSLAGVRRQPELLIGPSLSEADREKPTKE